MAKGRPKLSKRETEARKNSMIEIARRLFLDNGYASVSMRKIAAEANVSPMTLYQSFKNKREILHYIWTDIFVEVSQHCASSVASATGAKEKLQGFCSAFLGYWLNHPEHYRVVYLEADKLEGSNDAYFAESVVVMELFDQLNGLARAFAPHDTNLELKVKLLVLQLQGIAHGLITISEISWGDPQQLLDYCLQAFELSIQSDVLQ